MLKTASEVAYTPYDDRQLVEAIAAELSRASNTSELMRDYASAMWPPLHASVSTPSGQQAEHSSQSGGTWAPAELHHRKSATTTDYILRQISRKRSNVAITIEEAYEAAGRAALIPAGEERSSAAPPLQSALSGGRPAKPAAAAPKPAPARKSWLRQSYADLSNWFTMYRQLFTLIVTASTVALVLAATGHFPWGRRNASDATSGLIMTSVLFRSEFFLRIIYWLTVHTLRPWWAPHALRVFFVDILHHVGGIHSGCAIASITWLGYATARGLIGVDIGELSGIATALHCGLLLLLAVLCVGALPPVRRLHHNYFEVAHRFLGWTALAVLWTADALQRSFVAQTGSYSAGRLFWSVPFWLQLVITVVIVLPWLWVRKIPVTTEASPARDNIVIYFNDQGVDSGFFGRVSRSPWLEWHTFAAIGFPEGRRAGKHMMIVSALGDWTKGLVADPPTHLWVRSFRYAGLPYLLRMFRRATAVCTGAGIAPILSTMLQGTLPLNLVWIAKDLPKSFPPHILAMVMQHPRITLWDTKAQGRPDLAQLTIDAYREFDSEIVIITSNPRGTKVIMEGCAAVGIPAFGPTWDS